MIVRFFDWDQPKNAYCGLKDIKNGDTVVIDHEWGGTFMAEVLLADKNIEGDEPVGSVVRKATSQDREIILNNKRKESQWLSDVKKEIRQMEVPMKAIRVEASLDGGCLVIVFTAEGRIDFREMVRKFSNQYHKTVRFQQIGSRDEARRIGGYGICGREICCMKFPGSLKSISTDMARSQLISQRGSDRISGVCGRLMCCLAFEADRYKEMQEKEGDDPGEEKKEGEGKK